MKTYLRRHLYKWHRISGMLVALPILMWTVSGFLHPVMNSFKPGVSNQPPRAQVIDTHAIRVSLRQAMEVNHIASIYNFRIVQLNKTYYYQLQRNGEDALTYVSCEDGTPLTGGDALYAADLAKQYLSAPVSGKSMVHGHSLNADARELAAIFASRKNAALAKVSEVKLITRFDQEYKVSNKLLPVYRVSFHRDDHIRLYIETATGRLAAAIDDRKAWFTRFFATTHSWSFLDGMGNTKQIVMAAFSFLCFLSSLFGFLLYNIINKKKASSKTKSWHRLMGNVLVATTMLFALSGGWHALHKLSRPDQGRSITGNAEFPAKDLDFSPAGIMKKLSPGEKLFNVSVVKIDDSIYWQLQTSKEGKKHMRYLASKNLTELASGDQVYARYLASRFSGFARNSIQQTQNIYRYNNRYSMMNKRLPVEEVSFANGERYYVETATGTLATVTDAHDEAERFSFSNLHMHHYAQDWFGANGKAVQKGIQLITTGGLLLLALTGIWIYAAKARQRRNR